MQSVYLITYIQVDLSKFPTRKSFAETLSSSVRKHYSMEKHKCTNGEAQMYQWGPLPYVN